jgi:hypothetical protein
MPVEHIDKALPYVTTTPCPSNLRVGRQALQGRPCARNVRSCLQSPMPLQSLDAALLCILLCVLHGPLARIGQCLVTRACGRSSTRGNHVATTRSRTHGESTHSCACFTSAGRAPCPLATALDWAALIGIPQSACGTPPQPRLSPPSDMVATTGAFPAHISTGTGLLYTLHTHTETRRYAASAHSSSADSRTHAHAHTHAQ